jgi:hypothetical protein
MAAKQSGSKNIIRKLIIGTTIAVVALLVIFSGQITTAGGRLLAAVGSGAILSPRTTHEQEVWLHALEWCESRGLKTAVNPKDVDGTPSYYSFQFKPSTFKLYGIRYGLLSSEISEEALKEKMTDYQLQKKMVSLMFDDSRVNWRREFPDCVRGLGAPPLQK